MTYLTMGPIVAEIMDTLGRPEAAETLRWSQRPEVFEDVATGLEEAEERVGELTDQLGELREGLDNARLYLNALKKSLDALPKLIEAVSAEIPHKGCDECTVTRLVFAVDEARHAVKNAVKAVTP